MSRRYVEVALPPPLSRELTYSVPEELVELVQAGTIVLVPLQRRLLTGFVLQFKTLADSPTPPGEDSPPGPEPAGKQVDGRDLRPEDVRDIAQVLDAESPLSPEIVELCRWMAAYYLLPLGSALTAALPPGVRLTSRRLVHSLFTGALPPALDGDDLAARIWEQLARRGALQVGTLKQRLGKSGLEQALGRLRRAQCIDIRPVLSGGRMSAKQQQQVSVADMARARRELPELQRRAPSQASCLEYVINHGATAKKSLVASGFSYSVLSSLGSRGLLETVEQEVIRDPLANLETGDPEPQTLTEDQHRVLDPIVAALDTGEFFPALLHGVTGSGKTLIYLRAVERVLSQGRGAIVLVPEIALAWQMVRRFKAQFGEAVTVMHSQLSNGERYDTWRRLRRGEQRLLIGARSAILAPVQDVGIIIVDEEHDGSYNQDDLNSRQPFAYSARDLAVVRARMAGAVVILGSATPSLETYWNAHMGKYHTLSLPSRIDNRPLARVEVVDMRREPFQRKQRALFSHALRLKMRERLERGEQIVLLQNRRGFAPVISCTSCGEAVQCGRCHVSLTYHRSQTEDMRCHYCDYRGPVPRICPSCGSTEVRLEGVGTQQVEKALLEQFAGIRVIRMDMDTTGWKGAHDTLVERFRRGEADVLLGTQMVAKGLDFPLVTLVGVISADTGLHMPDFRAAERSFQLLTQVAGRSGRGDRPGEVVIQTRLPTEPALVAAAGQDYASFAEGELAQRREAGFPPFGRIVCFRWRGPREGSVERAARAGMDRLKLKKGDWATLGPSPSPLARLRGQYRWQALLLGPVAGELKRAARDVLGSMRELAGGLGVDLAVVVDPQTTM
jgi:primosomal protein N' (replication factor Y)